jgi:hypothetical protein
VQAGRWPRLPVDPQHRDPGLLATQSATNVDFPFLAVRTSGGVRWRDRVARSTGDDVAHGEQLSADHLENVSHAAFLGRC